MKIIFDSEKQKQRFMCSPICPSSLGLEDIERCNHDCEKCMTRVIEMEVITRNETKKKE